MRRTVFIIAFLFSVIFIACGGGENAKKEKNFAPLPQNSTAGTHTPYVIEDSSKIVELGDGLKMYVVEEGSGMKPSPTSEVTIHYHGMLLDGSVFDSSWERNQMATFPLTNLIQGWQRSIPQTKVGSKIKLIVPPELGYGSAARTNIPANSTLIFDIELFGFK